MSNSPQEEQDRLSALKALKVLDTTPEWHFDCLTALAAHMFMTPIAAISLVDERRQWFKSIVGLELQESPRAQAFCDHTIRGTDPLIVEDATEDERFKDIPLVTGPLSLRYYAGIPINVWGHNVGTLCVIDRRKHQGSKHDMQALVLLANLAANMMQTSAEMDQKDKWIVELTSRIAALRDNAA